MKLHTAINLWIDIYGLGPHKYVLLTNQTNDRENGVYRITKEGLVRA